MRPDRPPDGLETMTGQRQILGSGACHRGRADFTVQGAESSGDAQVRLLPASRWDARASPKRAEASWQ